jgi:hypothetical protein
MDSEPVGTDNLVELRAQNGDDTVDVLMNRSLAEVQRQALEAAGWAVEIRDAKRPAR